MACETRIYRGETVQKKAKKKDPVMACKARQKDGRADKDAVIEKLKQTIVDADLQLAALEKEVDRLNEDLVLLQSSTSWRLTAPVRKMKSLAAKLYRMFRYRRHRMTLVPNNHPASKTREDTGRLADDGPAFVITTMRKNMPAGMVKISGTLVPGAPVTLELYIADEAGFSADNSVELISDKKGRIRQLVQLPDTVSGLRLDLLEDTYEVHGFKISEMGTAHIMASQLWSFITAGFCRPGQVVRQVQKGIGYLQQNGASATFRRMMRTNAPILHYQNWIKVCESTGEDDKMQMEHHIAMMPNTPVISVIMPVYNTPKRLLMAAIESVQNQIYPYWELCIADDASTLPYIRTVLEKAQKIDTRIKVVFRKENGHISACSNSALSLVSGEFIALLDHDDKLAPHALYMVAQELNRFPDADIIYSDEDKIDIHGQRFDPHFKPDWNPELFFSINYLSHLGVYRTRLLRSVNGFRKGLEGSQDYDMVLRCLLQTPQRNIRHIPHILYHWRAAKGSTALNANEKNYATDAGIRALKDYFAQVDPDVGVSAGEVPTTYRICYPVKTSPSVCLIIPTKNNHKMLKTCLDSITEKTDYENYHLAIINNQSDDPDTLAYLRHLDKQPRCRVMDYDYPFNYSAINNFAVKNTHSDMVCLVNDDVEVITAHWLKEMVSHAVRPDIGAVGAKLLYPDNRIQHAGVILGLGGVAGHSHKYVDASRPGGYGYFYRLVLPQAMSAVTAACLLVRRKVYDRVGGLNACSLKIAFNDVDLCLRIRKAGFRNVWTPHALLYHHESVSRGHEDTRAKQRRFTSEVAYMKKTWGRSLKKDPCYNPNLTLASEDFALGLPCRVKKPWQGSPVYSKRTQKKG